MTLLNFYQSFDIEYHKEKRENGDFMCVFPRTIKIFVGFADPTIYLNKTLEDNSCLQQKTLRHELNHLDNAHTFLKALVLALKANISQIIMDTGPVFEENSNVYFSQIKSFTDVYNGRKTMPYWIIMKIIIKKQKSVTKSYLEQKFFSRYSKHSLMLSAAMSIYSQHLSLGLPWQRRIVFIPAFLANSKFE